MPHSAGRCVNAAPFQARISVVGYFELKIAHYRISGSLGNENERGEIPMGSHHVEVGLLGFDLVDGLKLGS